MSENQKRISVCPDSPNCVSTMSRDDKHRMEPWPYSGDLQKTLGAIEAVMNDLPRTRQTEKSGGYLHYEVTSKIMRFVDDVEFFVDESQKKIHFRSASRVGYSDWGVNRERMNDIRSRLSSIEAINTS